MLTPKLLVLALLLSGSPRALATTQLTAKIRKQAASLVRAAWEKQPSPDHAAGLIDSLTKTMDLPLAKARARALIDSGKGELRFPDGGKARLLDPSSPEGLQGQIMVTEASTREFHPSVRFHHFKVQTDQGGKPLRDAYPQHARSFVEEGNLTLSAEPGHTSLTVYAPGAGRVHEIGYEFERSGDHAPQLSRTLIHVGTPRLLLKTAKHGTEIMYTGSRGEGATAQLRGPEWELPVTSGR